MSYKRFQTYIDVYKHLLFIKVGDNKSSKKNTVYRLINIWNKASLPVYNLLTIVHKFEIYLYIVIKLNKSLLHTNYIKYCQIHFDKYNVLFDICHYHC